jgi:AcrR family transcriptional regulator
MSDEVAAPMDGRRKRSERSRAAIVAAMIELVGEGHITPSAELVAERAGVGLRSVFRHFRDMDSLYAGMAERLASQYAAWQVPFTATDRAGRLDQMIVWRLDAYEHLMPYKRAADAHRHASATIQRNHGQRLAMMRERLVELLPDAVRAQPLRVEAVDLWLSFECWQRLRNDQQLSRDVAEAVVRAGLSAALGADVPSPDAAD